MIMWKPELCTAELKCLEESLKSDGDPKLGRTGWTRIAITLGLSEYYRLQEILVMCEKSGVHTKFIPDYNNIIQTKYHIQKIYWGLGHQYPLCAADQYVQCGGKTVDGYFRIGRCNYSVFSDNVVCCDADQADFSGTADIQTGAGGTA